MLCQKLPLSLDTLIKLYYTCRLKNDVQLESCELSFIWGKMRTVAGEATSQIALNDCSKSAVEESQYIRFWWRESSIPWSTHFTKGFCWSWGSDVTMKGFSASLDMISRIEIIKSVPKNIQLSKELSHQIPWSTECLTPPWIPGVVEGRQLQQHGI